MIDPSDPKPQASEDIITASGKMLMLDRLLPKLKASGHRVVMFSQYTRVLDILSDYLHMRGYIHTRLDGSTHRVNREVRITQFNKPGSETFVFLLSTRAGGEGVNLFTADTVILFDSDWNPQVRTFLDLVLSCLSEYFKHRWIYRQLPGCTALDRPGQCIPIDWSHVGQLKSVLYSAHRKRSVPRTILPVQCHISGMVCSCFWTAW